MTFKSEAQLKSFLLKKCKTALINAQEKVYKIIDLHVQRFYADYAPEMYERTYQLMHSLVKSDIRSTGNGYEVEVYFDLGSIGYSTGLQPSGEQVMGAAAYGGHGAAGLKVVYGGGANIWVTPKDILDAEAVSILAQELMAAGIPIK
jgi:hypothetical protein